MGCYPLFLAVGTDLDETVTFILHLVFKLFAASGTHVPFNITV